jgi:transcriptional regulator with XRE-family HTH domain
MLSGSAFMVRWQAKFGKCQMFHAIVKGNPRRCIRNDVAESQSRSSPTLRRRQLGAQLRALRLERHLTVEQAAEHLMVSPSKVSRLETGQRGASLRDVRDLSDLYEVEDSVREHLFQLAREARQRAWWQPLHLPYSTFIGLEAAAESISDFSLAHLPGLLQTTDYARAVMLAADPKSPADLVRHNLQARMTRQEVLTSGTLASYTVVIDESVIHHAVGGPTVMAAQIDHLLELSSLNNVAVHILPYRVGAVPWGNNKFIILDFADPAVSSVVFVETLTHDLYLDDPSDVQQYHRIFQALLEAAFSEQVTTKTLNEARKSYQR